MIYVYVMKLPVAELYFSTPHLFLQESYVLVVPVLTEPRSHVLCRFEVIKHVGSLYVEETSVWVVLFFCFTFYLIAEGLSG